VDSANTLTSKKGYYNIPVNLASFKTEVVGVNPDYTLTTDTLQYNSKTKILYFKDLTTIKDKEGGIAVYQNGYYDTNQKFSNLNSGEIETPSYKINGEKYFIDNVKQFYKAKGNVVMTSKDENMIIYGDDSDYNKAKGISKIYGHAYAAKITDEKDTLFIAADTLVSIENKDPSKKRLLAYNHVKIFKADLQGIADSLAYIAPDSTLHFYTNPVLWTDGNQMTADSIRMLLKEKKINKIFMVGKSFVVSQDSMTNFNQIKGRKMTANFDGKSINHVFVEGNGESLYFALQEQESKDSTLLKTTATMGMNRIVCSNMRINFKLGKVDNISFYVKPDASFIPPHELKIDDKKLKGFIWRIEDRPVKEEVVRRKETQPP
jgi:OstA-like protein